MVFGLADGGEKYLNGLMNIMCAKWTDNEERATRYSYTHYIGIYRERYRQRQHPLGVTKGCKIRTPTEGRLRESDRT